MSIRADPGVLLQHACTWFFNTCLSYSRSRYAHSCYIRVGIRYASCPKVEHLDYLGYERLRTVSKDEMISAFCERLVGWGDRQLTPCKTFAKGPRFINMVMTFVLHPLSHYNSITEPRAWFLLSILEHLTMKFSSHFILSIIDMYRDMATRDRLIFPSAVTRILCQFSVPCPSTSPLCVPLTTLPLNEVRSNFDRGDQVQ